MKKVIYGFSAAILVAITVVAFYRKSISVSRVYPDANVLLITIDTIRPDRISCYGGKNPTPNLDSIAEKGVRFENAFCQVPLTFPSHTSILTGMFPTHHGVHNNGLEIFTKKDFLISKLFRQNGYKTAAVVSSFVLDRKFGLSEGFDIYDDHMERLPEISSNFEVERPANESVQSAIKILDEFGTNKWFLWLHFYDPHTPYSPPEPMKGYDGEVAYVDQQVGTLLKRLDSRKQDQNLILAILGDHGESLGEHGEQTHGFFVYNSTLMIPMMLLYPGAPAGKRIIEPVSTTDIAGTLLQLAGIQDLESRDGESLLPLVDGAKRQNPIYFESAYPELMGWNGLRGIFQSDWKLISTTRSELFDWRKDPEEATNLYSKREDVSQRLEKALGQYARSQTTSSAPDAETVERLKSLGYVSTTTIAKTPGNADPKDKITVWAEYERSLRLKNEGKASESLELLKTIVAREPSNNFFRVSLATASRQTGDLPAALENLEEAVRNDPSDANAYQELAITYKEQRNFAAALKAEDAALALGPKRSEFHSLRGTLLVEIGRFEEAKKEFEDVLGLDPNNAVAWNNYGNALRETNQFEAAVKAYQKAIELSPNYAYPLNGLATILIRKDLAKEAIPYLEKAIRLDPKFVEVYLNLAIAYHTLHEAEKARTLYRTFLKLAPLWMQTEREHARILLDQLS